MGGGEGPGGTDSGKTRELIVLSTSSSNREQAAQVFVLPVEPLLVSRFVPTPKPACGLKAWNKHWQ